MRPRSGSPSRHHRPFGCQLLSRSLQPFDPAPAEISTVGGGTRSGSAPNRRHCGHARGRGRSRRDLAPAVDQQRHGLESAPRRDGLHRPSCTRPAPCHSGLNQTPIQVLSLQQYPSFLEFLEFFYTAHRTNSTNRAEHEFRRRDQRPTGLRFAGRTPVKRAHPSSRGD